MTRTFSLVIVSLACVVMLSVLAVVPRVAHSQSSGTPITGYAWSDTTGWIDLNCENQDGPDCTTWGLSVGQNGQISGYAWSDNIGWISANASDLSGCPSGPCTATLLDGALTGWLKALSADNNGWDGWISLSGPNYGPTLNSGGFTGYAWGSDVVGWVDFEYAKYVTCTPAYSCSGSTIQYTDSSCTVSNVTMCTAVGTFCSPGLPTCQDSAAPVFNQSPDGYTGHLQVNPELVHQGDSTTVHWSVSYATGCTVTGGNGDSWTGGSGSETTSPIEEQTSYTLSCTGDDGSSVNETQAVNILPTFEER